MLTHMRMAGNIGQTSLSAAANIRNFVRMRVLTLITHMSS